MDARAHRGAVVVPENLLVEVVKELLLELEHHLPREGPSEQAGPHLSRRGAHRARHPPHLQVLTFRSLSDSRNISFTTSLVSAARTVCIVAFVQRVWERHGRSSVPGDMPARCPSPPLPDLGSGAHTSRGGTRGSRHAGPHTRPSARRPRLPRGPGTLGACGGSAGNSLTGGPPQPQREGQ